MRTATLTVLLFLICALPVHGQDTKIAPDWTLQTADGESVNLADVARQQPAVLFFWATWCPYCKALMPHLQSIRLQYGDDVEILAINIKEDGDPVALLTEEGYDFTLLLDGDAVAEQYGVRGTPAVFVVDHQRRIAFDLRDLPRIEPPATGKPANHRRKAAFRAPYWAAEIRRSIDVVLAARE